MPKYTKKDIQKLMRKLDFCLMTTVDARGRLQSRPMSNNKNVDYDGTSYFFTLSNTDTIKHLKKNNQVTLTFQGAKMLFIEASGKAKLINSRPFMEKFWQPELEMWFKKGLDTKGIVMIKVDAKTIRYWHQQYEGKMDL